MNLTLISTILTLSAMGSVAAIILYFVSRKFYVHEDPRIDQINDILPGANCGGCGYAGCRAFAEAIVSAGNLEGFSCPVGGSQCMEEISKVLGVEAAEVVPLIPVVHCNGTCENRPRTSRFDGASSCAVVLSLYDGDTGCSYGCLGQGDCVASCEFGAMSMNPVAMLPEVNDDKCVACGACVRACSRNLISMHKRHPKNRKIYVSCKSEEKGGLARKSCSVACIGCGKCVNICPFDAIIIENNLASIDPDKCRMCRKCVDVCPTGAIMEVNFPPRKNVSPDKDKNKKEAMENRVVAVKNAPPGNTEEV